MNSQDQEGEDRVARELVQENSFQEEEEGIQSCVEWAEIIN